MNDNDLYDPYSTDGKWSSDMNYDEYSKHIGQQNTSSQGQSYDTSYGQPYGSQYNQGFGASNSQPYGSQYNQGYGSSNSQPYGSQYNQGYGSSNSQPYGSQYNQGYGLQYNQGYGSQYNQGYDTSNGQNYNFQQNYSSPPTPYRPTPPRPEETEDAGFICGIVSCCIAFFSIIFHFLSVAGLTLGIICLVQSRKNIYNKTPKTFGIIGTIVNGIILVIVIIIISIYGFAIYYTIHH
ncbi:hypothetical protein SAMN02910369_02865 [Lachnospiraceae bacterium NE2001]|nr:hypothetical protein SAMN02910369_02865 [Lachnospiraceae bacterium NE2001]